MRDAVVLAFLIGAAPICLFFPYFGILMWFFVGILTPHRFAWGIAYNFPAAAAVSVPTLVGTLFARNLNREFFRRETLLLMILWLWFAATVLHAAMVPEFAFHLADGQRRLIENSKILLMTMLAILIVSTPERLKNLYLVTAGCIGLLALKGAAFAAVTGGKYRIYGTKDSFISDNNDFALAVNMALPMLFFLSKTEERRWLRWFLRAAFFAGILSVILSYSRGGLLGLVVVMAGLAIKAKRKLVGVSLILVAVLLVGPFLPATWTDRMSNFAEGHVDQSADQRFVSWGYAWNLAKHYPIMGGGFEAFSPELFAKYQLRPLPGGARSSGPHSVYFQVIAEQGFVGMALYLTLLFTCIFGLRKLRRRARRDPALQWMVPYTHISELGLYAFMTSGAFLGRAYFDLYFQIVAFTAILGILYKRHIMAEQAREADQMPLQEPQPAEVT